MTDNKNLISSVKKLPRSLVEMTVSVPATAFDATRATALERIGADIELPGFRKGKAPAKLVEQKVGEGTILEEMAEIVIAKAYPELLREHKIDALGRPDVRITKIAMGNPLEFTLTTAMLPEVELPDYLKLAAKQNAKRETPEVSDADLEKTVSEVKKIRAQRLAEIDGKPYDPEAPLPELTDDFVKTLGTYESVADFMTKAREEIGKEKTRIAAEKHRIGIIEAVLEKTAIDLPDLVIAQELDRMEDEFRADMERAGLTIEKYMEIVKKTKDELRKDWRGDAEKRAKIQMLVAAIARKENIEPETEALEREMNKLHILYPNAPLERIRGYVDMVLTNELVFKRLEETK